MSYCVARNSRRSSAVSRALRFLPAVCLVMWGLFVVTVSAESVARAAAPHQPATFEAAPSPVPLFAADEPAQNDESGDDEEATLLDWISKSGWAGGIFMGILFLFSVIAVTIALERFVNLTREKMLPAGFLSQLRQLTADRNSDAAAFQKLCDQFEASISTILKAGLLRAGRPLTEVEKTMEDAAARETSSIRSRVRPLSVIAAVAPLVGLLGTVMGMILAFHTTSQEGTGKAELLAEGIYLALLTTAAGLTIAIPAMLLAAYFNSKVERHMREIDEVLMEAMPCLADMEGAAHDAAPTPPAEKQPAATRELATASSS